MTKDCVSLDVAKKLQEVGYRKECSYEWIQTSLGGWKIWPFMKGVSMSDLSGRVLTRLVCPTATQLIEEMIKKIEHFHFGKNVAGGFFLKAVFTEYPIVNADSFADCLGLMMCFLIEKKLL